MSAVVLDWQEALAAKAAQARREAERPARERLAWIERADALLGVAQELALRRDVEVSDALTALAMTREGRHARG